MFTKIAHADSHIQMLENPIGGVPSIQALLFTIVDVLLVFAVPVIVFFVIFAGFTYVTAQGNPEKIKTASRSLMYSLIGGVIVMGAFAISSIIQSIVNEF